MSIHVDYIYLCRVADSGKETPLIFLRVECEELTDWTLVRIKVSERRGLDWHFTSEKDFYSNNWADVPRGIYKGDNYE